MLKMKKISETYDMKVFTDTGDYFGDIEESILTQTKVFGWRVPSDGSISRAIRFRSPSRYGGGEAESDFC